MSYECTATVPEPSGCPPRHWTGPGLLERFRANSDDPAEQLTWRRVTAEHADRLGAIMAEHGWPTAELVGAEAARAAWLIAQHADRQLDVQRRALQLMQEAVAAGTAAPRELAFLRDRTLVNEGRR